jgi:spore coat protein CotH
MKEKIKTRTAVNLLYLVLLVNLISCSQDEEIAIDEVIEIETPDWNEQSHGDKAEPDYQLIFPDDKVNRIDIKIEPENWKKMQADLVSNVGSGQGTPGQPPGDIEYDLLWVPCNIYFNDIQWYQAGIRYKGNSSLRTTYQRGIKKLPLKLDFDQFEDTYPAIKNQRFYGFKQLSLKNNFDDKSFMREKVASDLFREYGLVSPRTAFYRVYIDFGEGEKYFGLYTLVEEVDDTVIKTQYAETNGNLYKPEGTGASFAAGSFDISDMYKKTNETENDYSDIQQLYTIINSSERETSNELWKDKLNVVFDVPKFLKWLAANTTMQNWDTYGRMTHNYYLYNNPESGKLEWIPWDNNEALQDGKMGGALSLSLSEVGVNWPIIRYIMNDKEWETEYKQNLSGFVNGFFNPERVNIKYENYRKLIREYVVGNSGEQSGYTFLNNDADFDAAVDFLKLHVEKRDAAVLQYLTK